jgi:hypothetical protein
MCVQVVFGTVVTRGPRSPLAASAMTEFEQACVLFTEAAVYSRRAAKALVRTSLFHLFCAASDARDCSRS